VNGIFDTLRRIGAARLMAAGLAVAIVGAILFVLVSRFATPNMALLFSDLGQQDGAQIVARLEQQGVPYELRAGGSQIWVPEDRALRMRMALAEQGLPRGSSVGYELFDRTETLGTTSFVQNLNHLRALEGELARTIGSLGPVAAARVHLVVPRRELFSRDRQEPSASVVLRLREAGRLPRQQVNAIQHLVASAVPGLRPSRVSLVDDRGTLLARGQAEGEESANATNAEELRRNTEQRLARAVEDLLERTLGPGKVRAEVSADMDFDRIVTNTEQFDPDGQVVRSTQSVTESNDNSEANANNGVSVANNLPDAADNAAAPGRSQSRAQRNEETTNYEITRTTRNHVREGGTIRRLSVAVLVDGATTPGAGGQVQYAPRSQEELDRIAAIVRTTVGFNAQRGDTIEVANLPFYAPAPVPGEATVGWYGFSGRELVRMVEVLGLVLVAGLLLLLVARPMLAQFLPAGRVRSSGAAGALQLPAGAAVAALPAPDGAANPAGAPAESNTDALIDMARIQGKVRASAVKKVGEIIDMHPDEAVAIIRNWMYQRS
jgi:flagellar M-ring protein FliF